MSARKWRLVIDENADADLQDALLYTQRQWGSEQRRRYPTLLFRSMRSLLDFPERGPERENLHPRCRILLVEQHIIYYDLNAEDNEIVVGRILHANQDPTGRVMF